MRTIYSLLAETEKNTQSHLSVINFSNSSDALAYKKLFEKHFEAQDNVMLKLASQWFEVKFYIGYRDSEKPCFESWEDSLGHLIHDFKRFQDFIKGLAADFFEHQITNHISCPDLTLVTLKGGHPSDSLGHQKPSADKQAKDSNEHDDQEPKLPG